MSSREPERVLAIVPTLNEARSVGSVVREIRATNPGIEVLVVDDGSTDGSGTVARAAGALVCTLPFNLGVGGAMRAGYRFALEAGYDAVVQVDGDGQHDPAAIPLLLEGLGGLDVVVGARFAGIGDYRARGPRRWAMALLATVLSWLAGTRLTDVTSGFRAVNRRAVEIFAQHYPAEYLGDTVEALVIALRTGCTVGQTPVAMRMRAAGRPTQHPLQASLYLLRAVVALGLALVRRWPLVAHGEEVTSGGSVHPWSGRVGSNADFGLRDAPEAAAS